MTFIERAAHRLQEIREASGFNQKDFALRFGVHPSTYNRYESGEIANMPQSLIAQIAETYSINPLWILGYDGVEKFMLYDGRNKGFKTIPILGTIAAGVPLYAQEDLQGYERVAEDDCLSFCLSVKGDSMIGARIYDGDIVFVRQQEEVENGDIAVVMIDDEEATLKRVYKQGKTLILHPENPTMKPLHITPSERRNVRILGKVKYVKFEAK